MGGRFKAITAYSLRLERDGQVRRNKEGRWNYMQPCLPATWELPWPVPPAPSSAPTTRPFALWCSGNTRTDTVQYSFVQCEVDKLDFAVLVAPTCSAPVLRFEFPLPTLALSKSPAACSLCPLFCTGVAVFVPSKQFFFIYFQSLFLSLFLISEFYQFRGNNNFAIDGWSKENQ